MGSIAAARRSTSDVDGPRIYRIAVDTLGADAAPRVLALGALDLAGSAGVALTLVGDAQSLEPLVGRGPHRVVGVSRAITNDDSVRDALRGKIDSSMRRAISLVARGDADAAVSAGNTGALMALARHLLPMLPGIDRPAIVKPFAGRGSRDVLVAGCRRQSLLLRGTAASLRRDGGGGGGSHRGRCIAPCRSPQRRRRAQQGAAGGPARGRPDRCRPGPAFRGLRGGERTLRQQGGRGRM